MTWSKIIIRITGWMLLFSIAIIVMFADFGRELTIGDEIAYVSRSGSIGWDIHLMDIDRGLSYAVSRIFIKGEIRSRLPAWSANGDELVFVSEINRRQGMNLLVMNPEIPSLRVLTHERHDETSPVWSPLGVGSRRIAYESFNGWDWDIHVRQVRDNNTVLVQDRPFISGLGDDRKPQWSSDGRLAFISNRNNRNYDLYIADSSGQNIRRITERMDVRNDFAWSPTGKHIAFVSHRDNNQEIYLVNVESGAVTNLTISSTSDDYSPAWSPDGENILFISDRDGDNEIYVMSARGDDLRKLTDNRVYDAEAVWSSDGEHIIYVSEPFFTTELYIMNADGSNQRRLTHNFNDDWSPAWRPR